MANAWCINAYNCDWCLIQTLWTLDSANIWVWVQFCAPDPLDDKRLDYIKYTDKCWNTCCITWENELLIYATQWVIKNLTLTNDDANEVVNVKRTDLFWSNRKKTVVRYKTWWYPTSITDWTLAVEELVQNQYQSSWYNVSWLSDWTTYYFTAFAVAQDDTIIVVQSWSITPDFRRSSRRLDTTTQNWQFDIWNTTNYWLCLSEDWQYLYVWYNSSRTVKQFRLSTPFDITTASSTWKTVAWVSWQHGVFVSPDWKKLYALWHDNYTLIEYTMTTPHDLTTATWVNVSLQSLWIYWWTWLTFSGDWLSLFIWSYSRQKIYKISTQTPFTLSWNSLSVVQQKSIWFSPRWISISNDWLHIFMWYNRNMVQWNLTTANDISTASSAYSKSTPATNDNDYCWTITKDWKYLYYIYNDRYVVRLDFTKAS